jgi:eukaryotic-like serine/threonine-protein kinase
MDADGGEGDDDSTGVEGRSLVPTVSAKKAAPGAETGEQRPLSNALTPDDAMRADEVLRNRLFLKIAAALGGTMAIGTAFLSDNMNRRLVVACSCSVVVIAALGFQRLFRDEKQFTQRRWMAASLVLMAASCIGVYYIGVFSPAPMVGTLGMYFLCLGSSPSVALVAYIVGGVLHFVAAAGFAFRMLPDPGVFTGKDVSARDMLIAAGMVQIVYFLTFILARGSRKATRATVARLHEALQQVQKREALLAEAHQDLDRALKAGVAGRYTERKLGPYVLHEVIGRGAMSEVYRAESDKHGGAAVKVLQRGMVGDPAQVQRFMREAEIVSALKSEHVVRVHSYGGFGESGAQMLDGDNPPYIAMELLVGHDLAWHLRQKRKLPPGEVLELCAQIAGALSEAERADIVHRDLKPQNVFYHQPDGAQPVWKVLDFGVSKLLGSTGTLTGGAIVGTPGYMAPEQARGEDVGPEADVFALAAIAYRALTGRPAFSGKDMPRVLFDVCYVQPSRPGRLAEVSEDVERALALGLAKNSRDRLSSARAFAEALSAAFAERLDARLRQRADTLLMQQPWDSRPAG